MNFIVHRRMKNSGKDIDRKCRKTIGGEGNWNQEVCCVQRLHRHQGHLFASYPFASDVFLLLPSLHTRFGVTSRTTKTKRIRKMVWSLLCFFPFQRIMTLCRPPPAALCSSTETAIHMGRDITWEYVGEAEPPPLKLEDLRWYIWQDFKSHGVDASQLPLPPV
jgi:hypothetical protein